MLILFALLLVTHQVAGQLQCPQVSASFSDDLDISSFSVSLAIDQPEGMEDDGNASDDDQYHYLINEGTVTSDDLLITINGSLSITLNATLYNSTNLSEVYMMISSVGDQSICLDNSGADQPLTDVKSIELQMECDAIGTTNVALCIYLTDQPFEEGNGTYHTITVPLNLNCTAGTVLKSQCEKTTPVELGTFCMNPSQVPIIFNSGEGQWHVLANSASKREFCMVYDGKTVPLLSITNTKLRDFPIYHNLTMLQTDVTSTNANSPYPLIFFVKGTSTNNSVTTIQLNTTMGIAKVNKTFTFDVAFPCFLEEGVMVNVSLSWSQFQQDGQLIQRSFDFQFYRDCTPSIAKVAAAATTATTTEGDDDSVMFIIVVPIVVLIVFLLFLIVSSTLCVLYYKSHYKKDPIKQTVDTPVSTYYHVLESPLKSLEQYGIEYDSNMVHIENKIGEGNFGVVYKARTPGLKRGDWKLGVNGFVAVKMLKADADYEMMLDFQKEVDTVVNFEHENVIRLLGICTEQLDQICMIFEYMELGALRELLRKSNPRHPDFNQMDSNEAIIKPSQFLPICIQLARGLDYLSRNRFVHRDIATRNCLVDSQFVCKIADFGLSRDVYGSDYYKIGGKSTCLPVRWMPPESLLYGRFTVKSDVWSYGILMWEVFTFATQPYVGVSNQEVIDKIRRLVLLERPSLCTQDVYDIMLECWEKMPLKRPQIGEILQSLEKLEESNTAVDKDTENYVTLEPLIVNSDVN